MKIQKIIFTVLLAVFTLSACNTESKKTTEVKISKTPKLEKVAINISGMTCEIGCAKLIQSKLSKKGGITSAKVIFKDSLGLVEYDANTISAKDINAFINGIAGGDLYNVKSSKQVKTFDQVEK
ncbi:MAG: cation transporter [Polaribacter sp.]|jgi:mercuric ion binding protein|nr:cation transporter [Polaribacter sp.]MDG1955294.1 cation transporter [Polaribacter sp.]MDG2073564.1 cation transporter [Polaribacter sp.]